MALMFLLRLGFSYTSVCSTTRFSLFPPVRVIDVLSLLRLNLYNSGSKFLLALQHIVEVVCMPVRGGAGAANGGKQGAVRQ